MGWLSSLRAIAQSVGAASRPGPEAPGEALLRDIRERARAVHASYEQRVQRETLAFEQDCAAALTIGGGVPPADKALAEIRFCDEALRAGTWRDTLRPRLRALTATERAALFDRLGVLRERIQWTAEVNNYMLVVCNRDSDTASRFGAACELLWRELLHLGFEVDAVRAGRVLALLAADSPGLRLKGSIGAHELPKLRVLRDIDKAAQGGLSLTEADRRHAAGILALIHDLPDHRRPKGPEKTDPPLVVWLKSIAAVGQQDGFFARMRRHPAPRVPYVSYTEPAPQRIAFWDAALVEVERLLEDVVRFRADKGAMKSWLTDPALFAAQFGEGDDPVLAFGWWNRDTKGEAGFSNYGGNVLNTLLHEEVKQDSILSNPPLTPERTAELRRLAATINDDLPFDFGTSVVPAIDLFTLEGADPSGNLIDHLVEAGDGAPGKTWLRDCDRLVDRYGPQALLDAFERWIALAVTPKVPEIDPAIKHNIAIYNVAFSEQQASLFPNALPEPGTDAYAREARRSALKAIARAPGLVKWRSDVTASIDSRNAARLTAPFSDTNQMVARGIAFCLSRLPASQAVAKLETLVRGLMATHYQRTICRAPKAATAAIWSLGQIGTREAAFALGHIRRQLTDTATLKAADKALAEAGKQLGLSADDMQEIAMADHGIGAGGVRAVELGGLRVELVVSSSTKAGLFTVEANGRRKRGIAKAFQALEGGKEIAVDLEAAAKDIELILPEARRRLEAAWRNGRSWDYAGWQDRLVGNGLIRTLTERLIWRFAQPDGSEIIAMIRDGAFIGADGAERPAPDEDARVHLWHPLESEPQAVAAWRSFLTDRRIRQPFIQAWRPTYAVTDAERATGTYSNRFAGHILEQAPAMAILKQRGWQAYNRSMDGNNTEHERVRLTLPHFGVAAQYWVSGIGSRIQEGTAADRGGRLFAFVTTDRVAFFALDRKTGKPEDEPIPVESVPARALCEAMYDIDLVVGRTSIGADRNWLDRGAAAAHPLSQVPAFVDYHRRYSAGQAGELARARHDLLARILPGLPIAGQCSLTPDFLLVDGELATYRINLGSGNILIAPDDRYLCIVPASRGGDGDSYVPYEGDEILSLILSKAMLLADDDGIEDASILSQIRRARG